MNIFAHKLKRGDKVEVRGKYIEVRSAHPGFGSNDVVFVLSDGSTICIKENSKINIFVDL